MFSCFVFILAFVYINYCFICSIISFLYYLYYYFSKSQFFQDVTQRRLINSSHGIKYVRVLRNVDKYLQSTQRKTPEYFIFSRTAVKISNLALYRVFLGEPVIVWENVPYVKIQ
jgi:hypothetical protein